MMVVLLFSDISSMNNHHLLLSILFLLYTTIHFGCSLRLISVDVPTMVVMGQPIWLNCSYDLENEELYSIKWYHWNANSEAKGEFYRWIPKDSPPGQMFQMEGIYLDLSRSSFGNVYLTKSDIYTDGSFRCEVSAEAPSFQTVRKEKELHIYSLPKDKPIILQNNGVNDTSHYGPGDLINLTCRTMPSRPPAVITWHINHELVDGRYVKSLPPTSSSSSSSLSTSSLMPLFHNQHQHSNNNNNMNDGLVSSRSQLFFYAEKNHFRSGLLKITCISDIIMQYTMSSEEIIIGDDTNNDKTNNQNNNKQISSQHFSPKMVTNSMSKDIPIITGLQHHYRPGDIVNLTCISRANPAPKLNFMVNDEEANPAQIKEYPTIQLSDGSFASKLSLKFKVKMENFGLTSSSSSFLKHQNHRRYSSSSSVANSLSNVQSNSMMAIKQYRIKCLASMEKNIYNAHTELHLGTSRQSSGLHFSENFAVNTNASTLLICVIVLLVALFIREP